MIPYNAALPLISIHIEKTGGTSFRRNLETWFGRKLYFHYPDPTTGQLPQPIRLQARWRHAYRRNICIHGHFNRFAGFGIEQTYPSVRQYITWLRDPIELHISLFSHQMRVQGAARFRQGASHKTTTDIEEFFECARCPILRALPEAIDLHTYQDILDRYFIHVGVLERQDVSLANLAEKLHRKPVVLPHENASPRTQHPSASTLRRFRAKHTLEYLLFDLAMRCNS